jgi:hypothetical protein
LGDIISGKTGSATVIKNIGSSCFCVEGRRIGGIFQKYILQSPA